MKANAWTGSAWGKGPATATDDQDYEGDDACGICLNAPEAVSLQPCKHKICAGCVDRLRYQLISTAESGVKCPFCRGFVSDYKNAADEGDSFSLSDANTAARFAAKAREAATRRKVPTQPPAAVAAQPRPQHPASSSAGSRAGRSWHCPKCRITNGQEQRECSQCNTSAAAGLPVVRARVLPAVGREPVAGSRAGDLIKLCNEKHHATLNQTLQAARTPALEGGGVMVESREAVLAAVKVRDQARLVHLVSTISEAGRWQDVIMHPYGSYTFQDLLQAAAYLRQHVAALHQEGVMSEDAVLRALGGQPPRGDLLGMLAKPLVDDALATLQHEKGWFVMARLNHLPAAECEIAAVLWALSQHLPTLLHLHTKAGQLHKAAWRLSDALEAGTPYRRQVSEALAAVAQVFLDHPRLLVPTLQNQHSFRFPVQALHGIPQGACLKLGRAIAESAQKISTDSWGAKALDLLFYLHATDPANKDAVRDLVCLTAKHLCGSYANLTMSGTEGAKLVRAVITRLAQEGEEDWFGWVCCELTVQAKRLAGYAPGWQTLMHGLAQPIMDDTSVEQHLKHLWNQTGELPGAEATLWATRRRIAQTHPQPPRLPEERCALQPSVITTASPPSPPPQPPPVRLQPAPPVQAQPAAAPAASAAVAQPASPAAAAAAAAATAAIAAAPPQKHSQALWPPLPPPSAPEQQHSMPASAAAQPASSQTAPARRSAALSFGDFTGVDAAAAAVDQLAVSSSPSKAAPPGYSAPGSGAQSSGVSAAAPAAPAGSSAVDMQMFFPSAGDAGTLPPQQQQQQTQQQPPQAPGLQRPAHAAQPPVLQQQQQQPAHGHVPGSQPTSLQPTYTAADLSRTATGPQPRYAQLDGLQQPTLSHVHAVYEGNIAQGYAYPHQQQQQHQQQHMPQQPLANGRPVFASQPAAPPPPSPQQPHQLRHPAAPQPLQPSQHQVQVPFQQQQSWQQQELLQQLQQPKQVAKRAPRAYQPLGAVSNGPVAPAPATAFSAARGQAQQQQQPPERRTYNPTQLPPPPPPRPPADPMVLAAAPSGGAAAGGLAPQQQNGWGGGGGLPVAQQPAAAAPAPAPAPIAREWWCPLCTYHHAGREAEFLNCAMCGSEKP